MSRLPAYHPQLAQLVKKAPEGPDWVHELKYDGYRIGCRIDAGRVTLISRNGKDWTEVRWPAVAAAAKVVRRMLHSLDLESWVKTTGGRGLHVVVPIEPRLDWTVCLDFARAVAEALVRHDPEQFTINFAKRERARLILVDYMRNNRTNTSIAAFSTRARPGAPVSMPLAWAELTTRLDPASFTVETAPRRLERLRNDPWADYFTARQRLTKTLIAALGQTD